MAEGSQQGNTMALREKVQAQADAPIETGLSWNDTIERQRPEITKAMQAIVGQDPERFMRVILTEIKSNSRLQACTPVSIVGSIMKAAQLGLEFGPLGHAYMVPYNNKRDGVWFSEAQLIIGYRGLIDLHLRSGKVKSIVARAVYENDDFDVWYDDEKDHMMHRPFKGDRGPVVRYYGRAVLTSGLSHIQVMEISDIEARRDRSKAKDSGPWKTDPIAMALKTVVRAMSTWLPSSVEVANALEADENVVRMVGTKVEVDKTPIELVEATSPNPPERSEGRVALEERMNDILDRLPMAHAADLEQAVAAEFGDLTMVDDDTYAEAVTSAATWASQEPPLDESPGPIETTAQEATQAEPVGDDSIIRRIEANLAGMRAPDVDLWLRYFNLPTGGPIADRRASLLVPMVSAYKAGDQSVIDLF